MITYEELNTLIQENKYEEVFGLLCKELKEYLSMISGREIGILSNLVYCYYLYDNLEEHTFRIYKIITKYPTKSSCLELYDILLDMISRDVVKVEDKKAGKKKIVNLLRSNEIEFAVKLYKEVIIYDKLRNLLKSRYIDSDEYIDMDSNELATIVEKNIPRYENTCRLLKDEEYTMDFLDKLVGYTVHLSPYTTEIVPEKDLWAYFESDNLEPLITELKEVFISLLLVIEDKDEFSEDLDELLKRIVISSKIKEEYKNGINIIFEIENMEKDLKEDNIKKLRELYKKMRDEYLGGE